MDPITLTIIGAIAAAVISAKNEQDTETARHVISTIGDVEKHTQTEATKRLLGVLLILFALAGLVYGAMTNGDSLPVYLLSALVGSGGIATLLSSRS